MSQCLTLGRDDCFCVSTRCSWESWVCCPDSITDKQYVFDAVNFFRERDISFLWPVYDDNDSSILEAAGLVYGGSLEGMTLNPHNADMTRANPEVKIRQVMNQNDARQWANTAWRAFSSFGEDSEDTTENYYAMFDAFLNDKNFSLYLAELDNKPAGTFMITHEDSVTGVYYFATLHEHRRKGVAASMMSEICRLSGDKNISLQATPMGRPFYRSFGFDELGEIRVYSTEPGIF